MNITDKIKQAVYESTQQIIKPVYNKIKETFSTKEETNEINQTVNELELRTHIGKELDYGYFTTGTISPTDGTEYKLQMLKGNMEVNEAGHVILKAYRKYSIIFENFKSTSSGETTTNQIQFHLKDDKGNTLIINDNVIANDYNVWARSSVRPLIIEPEEDIELILYCAYNYNNIVTHASANIMIEEINRQVILDPAEDAKNKEFEHGIVNYICDYSLATNTMIPYSSHTGNLSFDVDNKIKLTANKKYKIKTNIVESVNVVAGGYGVFLAGIDNFSCSIVPVTYTAQHYAVGMSNSIEIIPTTDIYIYPYVNVPVNRINVNIEIEEVAHPYYFNYFKDSLSSKVLFEGEANSEGEYQLSDDISNYKWLIVYYSLGNDILKDSKIVDCKTTQNVISSENITLVNPQNSSVYFWLCRIHFNENILSIDFIAQGTQWEVNGKGKIFKIEGIGFNYDNPYKDLISSSSDVQIEEFNYSDEEVTENLKGIWE